MNKKVLLADSSKVCLEIEQELLRKLPVKVFTAGKGSEALDSARKLRPDLIYMDLDIPGMDGAACCRAIKEDPSLAMTRVVLMAPAVDQKMELCRSAGCDAFLAKPIDRREFIAVGRSMLALTDRREERIPCRSIVTCHHEGNVFCGTLEDIALKGIFVGSHYDVKIGDILTLKFVLPVSGADPIETVARVVWINGGRVRRNWQLPAGFGVEFENLDERGAVQISEFIERSILWSQLPSEW
jgi:two-component system, OmpR family, alkaline phosphatase synthesis response regulator PhoP